MHNPNVHPDMPEDQPDLVNKVLEMRSEDPQPSQQEVADELDISQSQVSRIESAHSSGVEAGKEKGKEEGMQEAFEKVRNFEQDDDTEKPEEDEWWCAYCEEESGSKVEVGYLDDTCPNGHDLREDWSGVEQ